MEGGAFRDGRRRNRRCGARSHLDGANALWGVANSNPQRIPTGDETSNICSYFSHILPVLACTVNPTAIHTVALLFRVPVVAGSNLDAGIEPSQEPSDGHSPKSSSLLCH